MDGQDWKPTVLKRSYTKSEASAKFGKKTIEKRPATTLSKKLDGDEVVKLLHVSRDIGIAIQQSRTKRDPPMTQKDLAFACSLQRSVIETFENGTAIWNGEHARKIGSILGIVLKKPVV
jgi:ribosome-binding protein aMBF1 (putative translation factor)